MSSFVLRKKNADLSAKLSENWKVELINYPEPGQIEVVISGITPIDVSHFSELFIFKSSSTLFNHILIKKLNEIENSDRSRILGSESYSLNTQNTEFKSKFEKLNQKQQLAIDYLISQNLSGAIQGPPGTGKTQLLETVISLAQHSQMKICVAAFTNAAVDNLLGRVTRLNQNLNWVRIGDSDRVKKDLYSESIKDLHFTMNHFKKVDIETQLFGTTLHKLAFNFKSAPQFDLLIIDEAGQVPIYFWPFIERIAKRVILVGDQFQLPPVFSAEHTQLPFDNVFSFVINDETPMLETQYRMRKEIQEWSSEKFYKGLLKPDSSVEAKDFFIHHPAFYIDKIVSPQKFDSISNGKSSQKEADFIANKIERLLKSGTGLQNIGIICPYRAQAGIVNATLQNRFGVAVAGSVLIDTVERFQGQEKDVIFLSLGSSGANSEELRFLSDPKRLNVSVTRAKSRFYCLFDSKLIDRSEGYESRDLNEFLKWVSFGKTKIRRAA